MDSFDLNDWGAPTPYRPHNDDVPPLVPVANNRQRIIATRAGIANTPLKKRCEPGAPDWDTEANERRRQRLKLLRTQSRSVQLSENGNFTSAADRRQAQKAGGKKRRKK